MTKQEILKIINENPAFFLATSEGDQPRVRGMLIYKADEDGIVFHTGKMRDVFKQIEQNPKVEMCFNDYKVGIQVRVRGELELLEDVKLKDEIAAHPSRAFLKPWKDSISPEEFHKAFAVYRLKNGTAVTWTMAENLAPKKEIVL